ncbi:hypothetical protein E1265_24835 [Streptomyces sp. 8K308]|uniref:hypothetical protein n=1 Tax=Streptomyces sp. 8K308 TaxID=2530388 RepID=UPI001047F789|nr:hypothetical protein [Streptomyces sp. 8K308]TDC18790.1 hypothetical protein E1265_24835 [Streptomyces sp. 8K308]
MTARRRDARRRTWCAPSSRPAPAWSTGTAHTVRASHGLVGRVDCEPDPRVRRLFADEVSPVEGRYLRALTAALPELPPDEVALRYRAMIGLLALHQSGPLASLSPDPAPVAPDTDSERLTTLLTAAFTAPST